MYIYEEPQIVREPADDYAQEVYEKMEDALDPLLGRPYDECIIKQTLDKFIGHYTITPSAEEPNRFLLSIYFEDEVVLDFDFILKNELFDYFILHKEKTELDRIMDNICKYC